mmetsp:Transcript_2864/g.7258  ORF Transcript_2864/g.7258 Transcript_2864/m.7258 type:complete len:424 (-) Transcript_2864:329-1600(-)
MIRRRALLLLLAVLPRVDARAVCRSANIIFFRSFHSLLFLSRRLAVVVLLVLVVRTVLVLGIVRVLEGTHGPAARVVVVVHVVSLLPACTLASLVMNDAVRIDVASLLPSYFGVIAFIAAVVALLVVVGVLAVTAVDFIGVIVVVVLVDEIRHHARVTAIVVLELPGSSLVVRRSPPVVVQVVGQGAQCGQLAHGAEGGRRSTTTAATIRCFRTYGPNEVVIVVPPSRTDVFRRRRRRRRDGRAPPLGNWTLRGKARRFGRQIGSALVVVAEVIIAEIAPKFLAELPPRRRVVLVAATTAPLLLRGEYIVRPAYRVALDLDVGLRMEEGVVGIVPHPAELPRPLQIALPPRHDILPSSPVVLVAVRTTTGFFQQSTCHIQLVHLYPISLVDLLARKCTSWRVIMMTKMEHVLVEVGIVPVHEQ